VHRLEHSTGFVVSILICFALTLTVHGAEGNGERQTNAERQRPSPVAVADVIRMTQFDDAGYNVASLAGHHAVQFSPDGKRFVILVKKGDLKNNVNKYSLLLFETENALRSPAAEVLVSFSSTSNRPGIQQTKWIDSRMIAFLGENPGEVQQLYTVDWYTKRLTRLTNHATSVISYAMSANADRVFFLASRAAEPILGPQDLRGGFAVSNETLCDLITGERRFLSEQYSDLFVKEKGTRKEVLIRTKGDIASDSISLAPSGRYLLLKTSVDHVPEIWKNYHDGWLRLVTRAESFQGSSPMIFHYELIDAVTGETHVLMDAPINRGHSEIAWSPNSSSVVMSEIYLPLEGSDGAARKLRESDKFVVQIDIPSGNIVPITSKELKLLRWDFQSNKILLEPIDSLTGGVSSGALVAFQRVASAWEEVATTELRRSDDNPVDIVLEEDMNTPPRFFAKNTRTGQNALLLDLNPQFKNLSFGPVKDIMFSASDGHMVRAGLYYPPGYVTGRKYPLVIQTHAWNPHRFLIDGPWPSAFAAQPLAGRGIVVLQLEEDFSKGSTLAEAPEEMAAYEGGIDYLGGLGLIDRERVGVIGFSRTGFGVKYALTHSKYHFVAATVADGSDGGYFAYLSALTSMPIHVPDMEGVNGGAPFGEPLLFWLKNSPGFNLDKVSTAVREEAYDPLSLFFAWEWFAGLSRLRQPVELIYMPDATHLLTKPWERMTSQQGNVDWFCFWLKDEEDPDPKKNKQYARWRHLRDLQLEKGKEVDESCLPDDWIRVVMSSVWRNAL